SRIGSYRAVESSSGRTGTWSRGTSGIRGLFSSALQGAFDAAGMDHQVELLANQLRERGGSEPRIAKPVLEQEIDDEVGEFVGMTGTGSLRDQARQAGAVVERPGLIEDGTGEPEGLSDLGDGGPLAAGAPR